MYETFSHYVSVGGFLKTIRWQENQSNWVHLYINTLWFIWHTWTVNTKPHLIFYDITFIWSAEQFSSLQQFKLCNRTNRCEDKAVCVNICRRWTHTAVILMQTAPWLSKNWSEYQQNRTSIRQVLILSSSNSLSDIHLNQNITWKCLSHTPASQHYASSWTALSCQT